MPVFRHGGRCVLLVHIPKTGGTSIEKALKAQRVKVALSSQALHGPTRLGFPCSPQHFHEAILSEMFPPGYFDAEAAVVRDPMDRILSEYRHRMGILLRKGKSLIPFDRWVKGCLSKVARDPYFKDNHFRPQVEFIKKHARIFKFEEGLDKPIRYIAHSLNFDLTEGFAVPVKNPGVQLEVEVSARTRSMIEKFYKKDLESFGYGSYKGN